MVAQRLIEKLFRGQIADKCGKSTIKQKKRSYYKSHVAIGMEKELKSLNRICLRKRNSFQIFLCSL